MDKLGFRLYLVFMVSWFLRFGRRIPAWGDLRIDLALVIILILLCVLVFDRQKFNTLTNSGVWRYLTYLTIYIIVTIPLVEWPGSVVRFGLENFIKALAFFYFTVVLASDEKKLKAMVLCFIFCQLFRVAEPLYLHVTEGYWGSHASMWGSGGMEMMDRLAGSRYDVINPNGLAFVIVFVLPLLHFLSYSSRMYRFLYLGSAPFLLYALVLTGSRSGMVALFVIMLGIIARARHKVILIAIILCVSVAAISKLDVNLTDRYLSIFSSKTKNAATAQGRIEGIKSDFKVAMRKPIVGHGLGTSLEANSNIAGIALRSHNLYTEVMQEIGLAGLFIFLGFLVSLGKSIKRNYEFLRQERDKNSFIFCLSQATLLQFIMSMAFSLLSYGLSGYSWYLLAGLTMNIGIVASLRDKQQELQRANSCDSTIKPTNDRNSPETDRPRFNAQGG